MLLPLRPGLAGCCVFDGLNALLLSILQSRATGMPVDFTNLPDGLWAAVVSNHETNRRIAKLAAAVDALSGPERDQVRAAVLDVGNIRRLFSDVERDIPSIPSALDETLREIASHLFFQTAKLVGVIEACGEAIMDHYLRFSADRPPGNGNVCGMCGTEYLAQRRDNVAPDQQWRSPYDHLLSRDDYPIFTLHPENLLPVCRTCNEKAKLAKDLLHDTAGKRRLCFDPWAECAWELITMELELHDISPFVRVQLTGRTNEDLEKLTTWDSVYRISERVQGEFLSFREKLAEDIDLGSLIAFKASLADEAVKRTNATRLTPFNFWRGLLYRSLLNLPDHLLEQLRELSAAAVDPEGDAAAVYGI